MEEAFDVLYDRGKDDLLTPLMNSSDGTFIYFSSDRDLKPHVSFLICP
jgi:hypothetical protein